jgi:FkbH-like protein
MFFQNLSFIDLQKASKVVEKNFKRLKIAVLGDSSTQFLAMALKGAGVLRKHNFEIFEADYNQIEMQTEIQDSKLFQFEPDFIIIYQSAEKMLEAFYKTSLSERHDFSDQKIKYIESLFKLVKKRSKAKLIYFNFAEIDDAVFGSFSNKTNKSFLYHVRKINYELMDVAIRTPNFFVFDLLSIVSWNGRIKDNKMALNADMNLSLDVLPEIAKKLSDIVLAVSGTFKKCLIMDLDNTLWGGIIGDDGLSKIQIGELGSGKSFSALQMWIRQLKDRGIILSVCSKNDEKNAIEPFERHPDMILNFSDIAVFIANWKTKVENIRSIQRILNIGFDSMVFIDDNPFEREQVRTYLPEVLVPELPEDSADYLTFLQQLNIFETASFTDEDMNRNRQYREESQRELLKQSYFDENEFLKKLDMKCSVEDFNSFNSPRLSQLTMRSNQFNLRTIRYTEEDIARISIDNNYKTFAFYLSDKFGDHGLIALIILKKELHELFIDTWIMSCRVLKRGMENYSLNILMDYAKEHNFEKIIGEYLPTTKNGMVKDHYKNLKFIESNSRWVLNVKEFDILITYIERAR